MRKFTDNTLVLATHNVGKVEEMNHLLSEFKIKILSASEQKLPEPKETENSFVGNARLKAHSASKLSQLPALSDDSGIEIDHLMGLPGVYTADWAETPDGRNFDYAMQKVWNKLKKTGCLEPHIAHFCCTLVLAWPDGHDEVFEGRTKGTIQWPMKGENGHGFDPIFKPDGYSVTFGEMDRWEKNRISHRSIAFNKLVTGCFL